MSSFILEYENKYSADPNNFFTLSVRLDSLPGAQAQLALIEHIQGIEDILKPHVNEVMPVLNHSVPVVGELTDHDIRKMDFPMKITSGDEIPTFIRRKPSDD